MSKSRVITQAAAADVSAPVKNQRKRSAEVAASTKQADPTSKPLFKSKPVKRHYGAKRRHKKKGNGNIKYFRSDVRTEVHNPETGETVPLKTSAVFASDGVELPSSSAAAAAGSFDQLSTPIRKAFANVPYHRDAATYTKFSITGSPLQIATPNGSLLDRDFSNGVIYIYSNRKLAGTDLSESLKAVPKAGFYESEECATVMTPDSSVKEMEFTITDANMAQHKGKRYKSGGAVMASDDANYASADKYIKKAYEDAANTDFEWLHLIAFRVMGNAGQIADNLVLGTAHANTNMLFVENTLKFLAEIFNEFKLQVVADLTPGTQIAHSIKYVITVKELKFSFKFDPMCTLKPHVCYDEYVKQLNSVLVQHKPGLSVSAVQGPADASRIKKLSTVFRKSNTNSVSPINVTDLSPMPPADASSSAAAAAASSSSPAAAGFFSKSPMSPDHMNKSSAALDSLFAELIKPKIQLSTPEEPQPKRSKLK